MNHLLALPCAFAGFAALCLAMPRHQAATYGRKLSPGQARGWRLCGWLCLLASYLFAVQAGGWTRGSVVWTGELSLAAMTVMLMCTYQARWMHRMAVGAIAVSVLAGGVMSFA